jgi:hypothetical protein
MLICGLGCVWLLGCTSASNPPREDRIAHNLAQLDAADRAVAKQQKFCAVETENELGSMGVPVKVMIKGKPVFLCCNGCRKTAEAEPDKVLARANQLRQSN